MNMAPAHTHKPNIVQADSPQAHMALSSSSYFGEIHSAHAGKIVAQWL